MCNNYGDWNATVPLCSLHIYMLKLILLVKKCSSPPNFIGAFSVQRQKSYVHGNIINYSCMAGYSTEDSLQCLYGNWIGNIKCKRINS